jgi:DNA-binding NtrC family response regulator
MAEARGTVLIADDDPVSVEVLGDYLTRKQLGVVRAHTIDQALAELDSERPEVAVVGVRLGDTGELEAIKRIREVNVHVTVLATAAPEDGHLATAALGLGAADYLLKPIDFDYLGRVSPSRYSGPRGLSRRRRGPRWGPRSSRGRSRPCSAG